MLDIELWRRRILKAWKKKALDRRFSHGPKEATTRWQGKYRVSLLLWDHKHTWIVVFKKQVVTVKVDRPIGQDEVFRWLAKTTPID